MIYVIGIFVSLFLASLLFTKAGRNGADCILGLWMIVIGLHLFAYYSLISGLMYQYAFLIGFTLPFPFLHGPFLFLYAFALTRPAALKVRVWLENLLLPLGITLATIPFYSLPTARKAFVFQHEGEGFETYLLVTNSLLSLSGILYIYLTNRLLQQHKKRMSNIFSNQEKVNLDWLRLLFYGMGLIWLSIILNLRDELTFSLATVFVVMVGYFGIRQAGIFTDQSTLNTGEPVIDGLQLVPEEPEESMVRKNKYAKSGLSPEASGILHARLYELMNNQKLFLKPDLTLADLARHLDVHSNYLSQTINEKEGTSFYEYINGLRIEEFKNRVGLAENQKYTLLALAFDCGFNSKSAFNRAFKKSTGLSPSQYARGAQES
ncbi:helix-turn-helix domain-containing protein [Arundinibacter roseus]|uniref:AraC family transcriptional regulator n=1 Tax=Arundinibacter roseus TaxID=2070510 RepID=A0A4R4K5T8_9BACT|nr:helix-turn-helix domain-containing protein [Arundinibacter roseus]TDB62750.1 AraC family transcriptional regulator [Arundinibacter roseus]